MLNSRVIDRGQQKLRLGQTTGFGVGYPMDTVASGTDPCRVDSGWEKDACRTRENCWPTLPFSPPLTFPLGLRYVHVYR